MYIGGFLFVLIVKIVESPFIIGDNECLFESLQNSINVIDLQIATEITEFRGFLAYYIDKQKWQLIIQLNKLDYFLTIKFRKKDYYVNLKGNCNCISKSIKEFYFHINETFIIVKCNGQICAEKLVKPGGSIDDEYPLPDFKQYSVGLWLANHEKFINYNNKTVYPSNEQPRLVVYNLNLNGHDLLSNPKQPCGPYDKNQTSNHSTTKIYVTPSTISNEEGKTDTSYQAIWIVSILLFVLLLIFIVIGIIIWRKIKVIRRFIFKYFGLKLRPTIPMKERTSKTPQLETIIQMEPLTSQAAQSEITSNSCDDESSSTTKTETVQQKPHCIIEIESEQNYSSQSNSPMLDEKR